MFCTQCGVQLETDSGQCVSCSAPVSKRADVAVHIRTGAQPALPPPGDQLLRQKLLAFILDDLTSEGLSDWLRDLDLETRGSVAEKKRRITENSSFARLLPNEMVREAMFELRECSSGVLADLCVDLGLSNVGTKQLLLHRLHRHICERERLLPRFAKRGNTATLEDVRPLVEWYPLYQRRDYERDTYADFKHAMVDVFGEDFVLDQEVVAHGNALKIDFHVGPSNGGVGIEFKMPANNSDIQKALGQVSQYQKRYGGSLIVVVFPHLIDKKHELLFVGELAERGVATVLKRPFQWSA